jgi:hypothetical protein
VRRTTKRRNTKQEEETTEKQERPKDTKEGTAWFWSCSGAWF